MTYRVEWLPRAVNALHQIYNESPDQEGLRNSITRIGTELSFQPESAGESRDFGRRILFKFPLVIWFRIDERMKTVLIYKVRSLRQR